MIKIILLGSIVLMLLYFLRYSAASSIRAYKKVLLCVFGVLMAVTVIKPELANDAAHLVDVGRGADLLLYLSVLGFVFYVLSAYQYQKKQEQRTNQLARHIAINEAKNRYKL